MRDGEVNLIAPTQSIAVSPASRVMIPLAALVTGLTEKAIRRKIEEGKWIEGNEYHRDPDGRIWIELEGVMKWVVSAPA